MDNPLLMMIAVFTLIGCKTATAPPAAEPNVLDAFEAGVVAAMDPTVGA